MTAMAQRLRWRRGAGRSGRWRPRRVFVVVAAVLVGVMAVGVSAVLIGQGGRGRAGYDEGTSAVGTAASPVAPPYSMETAPAAPSGRSSAADSAAAPNAAGGASSTAPTDKSLLPGAGRDLVRTGQLTLDVDDVAARGRQVRTAATAVGGVVVQEQSGDDYASLTVRVPVDSMDKVTDDVAGLGKVTNRSAQVSDVTGDVVDLDARVRSQQASVDRVRALLAQAQSIGDVVSIESELASREADLDSLTGRLASLRDQVAMSTLTVDLRGPAAAPVPVEDPASPAGWSEGLAAGWAGLKAVGTATAAVAGFLLPMLPLVAVVLGLVWGVRRIVRGRRPAPPAGAPAPAPTATS
jgi:predicted lipid-binding transport protein (Tim44 family)